MQAVPARFGDFDEDGQPTVLDLVRLISHITGASPFPPELLPYADLNQDGFVNDADVAVLRDAILGRVQLPGLPLTRVRETSPAFGEVNVSVNRETVMHLTQPLSSTAVVGTNHLLATFGGRRILSRSELSTDRRTLTLFYLEPLPASARIRVTFDPAGLSDFLLRGLDADGDGVEGGRLEIDFDTAGITPVSGTAVIGQVFASDLVPGNDPNQFVNRPLANVTVTVDGAEQILRTTTDATGFFKLSPCPSGRFFVHVDGRTAVGSQWPSGAYYPFVGKAWEAQAGYTSNLAGGNGLIYLPLIPAATLQSVSQTADTTVTFAPAVLAGNPGLAGVSITVPANSLFSENGTRGGKIGMAPVPPDRLPEPLPPGLNLPLVITIQTDGPQNLDRPATVRFPNLPDPVTALKLPPGAKTALWSFNHDTGRWEIQGPMTVTADGHFAESDPGVGIRQPGWHGIAPGNEGGPPPPPNPPPPPDPCDGGPTPKPGWDPSQHSNGCGPEGYDYLVPDGFFGEACNQHDIGYSTCNKPKSETDNQFLQDMLAACKDAPFVVRVQCIESAYLYYAAVSKGGGGAYNDAQGEACDCFKAPPPPSLAGLAPASEVPPRVVSGRVYYAVINDMTHQVVRRGSFVGNPGAMGPTILAPDTPYRLGMVEAETLLEGSSAFVSPGSGQRFQLPRVALVDPRSWDLDGDGLHDLSEFIVGTDPRSADSDGDGVPDGAELQQGTDPLSGLSAVTGVIAAASTGDLAVDVCVLNDLAVVADSAAGIVVFNVANRQNPVRIASVNTPGNARSVACSGNLIAVADDGAGLAIVDSTDPPAAFISRQLDLGSPARCVVAGGNIAYVGLGNGNVVAVDLTTGTELDRLALGGNIQDLAISDETLYVHAVGTFSAIPLNEPSLRVAGSVGSPGSQGAGGFRLRLFVGGGLGYATFTSGYNIFDLSQPLAPKLVRQNSTSQFGWQQIVANGSGLGLATVGPNSTLDGPHSVSLYNLNPGGTNSQFITTYTTPGVASAVSIYNGLAYVADRASGLSIINYLAEDRSTNPPSIQLSTSFSLTGPTNGLAEEGKLMRATAQVSDDVQVRNVEFYIDGVKAVTDGNFPFEHRFVTPVRSATKDYFTLQAKATDTAGNLAWTPVINVQLVPDATPPAARRFVPGNSAVTTNADAVFVYFSEPIDLASLNSSSFQLLYAGPDNRLDTADDRPMTEGLMGFRDTLNAAVMEFRAALAQGLYRVSLGGGIRDRAGNPIAAPMAYTFWIIRSGADGDEDNDGLTNSKEIAAGTNPFIMDSDGDGWDDGVELADRTDPMNPLSHPSMLFLGRPAPDLQLPGADEVPSELGGTTVGRPGVDVQLLAADGLPGELAGVTLGRPGVLIELLDPDASAGPNVGLIIGRPGVETFLPDPAEGSFETNGPFVGRPLLQIELPEADGLFDPAHILMLANPPVKVILQAQ